MKIGSGESGDKIVYVDPTSDGFVPYKMDEGLQFGLGFFETILIRNVPYFLKEHLHRLNKSLKMFGFERYVHSRDVEELIQFRSIKNTALKLIATEKNLFAVARPIPYNLNSYQQGMKVTSSTIIKNRNSRLTAHKTLNYGENILELRKARELGYDDCLFFNENGHITESAVANLFIIYRDKLITPPIFDGVLPGVIRQNIIENFDVCEKHVGREHLRLCQGAFLTNSLMGAIRITNIDGMELAAHPLYGDIIRFFGKMIPQKHKNGSLDL